MAQEQSPAGRGPAATVGRLKSHGWHHKTPFGDQSWSYFGAPRSTQESRYFRLSTILGRLGRVLGSLGRPWACI